jgi:hypothetical protein
VKIREREQRLMAALVKAVGAMLKELPALRYCGVWKADADYVRGNFVTFNGGLWHCNDPCKDCAPGQAPAHWTLAVKSGRDKVGSELGSVVVKVEADVAAIERTVEEATKAVEHLESRLQTLRDTMMLLAHPHVKAVAEFMTKLYRERKPC